MRIGLKIGDRVADLTAAFEKYLEEEERVPPQSPLETANVRMPASMLSLTERENYPRELIVSRLESRSYERRDEI